MCVLDMGGHDRMPKCPGLLWWSSYGLLRICNIMCQVIINPLARNRQHGISHFPKDQNGRRPALDFHFTLQHCVSGFSLMVGSKGRGKPPPTLQSLGLMEANDLPPLLSNVKFCDHGLAENGGKLKVF
ncbi:hypothetical protein Ancab_015900 [Ancistrocladus abbreviatus]